ncbi:MAG: RNA-binding protein [Nitrospinae bacterium]|nr:RNA-binding protein [Nitrospinota bacterium]
MPKGPQGQKRKADVIGNAIQIAHIATGEIEDTKRAPEKDYTRKGGLKGGRARSNKLQPEIRSAIAKKAASIRWQKSCKKD